MSTSIKDALELAYKAKGIEIPKPVKVPENLEKSPPKSKSSFIPELVRHDVNSKRITKHNRRQNFKNPANHQPQVDTILKGISVYHPTVVKPVIQPTYKLNIPGDTSPKYEIQSKPENYCYIAPTISGIKEQACEGNFLDERELVIGLDFGTSSTKIIIGDHSTGKAFAIPFSDVDGVNKYLIPSRLYESDSEYSLMGGQGSHRDLKLSLLANPTDLDHQVKVTAFLALLIRHARAWILSEHRELYLQSKIFWKLTLGIPSAHHLKSEHQEVFYKLAAAAWHVSADGSEVIKKSDVVNALKKDSAASAEISVIPELSAQIYGYVSSSSFDPNRENIFLMVDIGAGTLDSSLFKVTKGRGGKWDFTFYTSEVQPNGVMNLHRNRMNWWKDAFDDYKKQANNSLNYMPPTNLYTDQISALPEHYQDYFSGVKIEHSETWVDPDSEFFNKKVLAQLIGRTIWRAWRDNLLLKDQISGTPMYLCGGGARMAYYSKLEEEMNKAAIRAGSPWQQTQIYHLVLPKNLIAEGLLAPEFDRLSVAFGLSFLEVSKVLQAIPAATIAPNMESNWQDNYISKDFC